MDRRRKYVWATLAVVSILVVSVLLYGLNLGVGYRF
jgi:hypothetical protein